MVFKLQSLLGHILVVEHLHKAIFHSHSFFSKVGDQQEARPLKASRSRLIGVIIRSREDGSAWKSICAYKRKFARHPPNRNKDLDVADFGILNKTAYSKITHRDLAIARCRTEPAYK